MREFWLILWEAVLQRGSETAYGIYQHLEGARQGSAFRDAAVWPRLATGVKTFCQLVGAVTGVVALFISQAALRETRESAAREHPAALSLGCVYSFTWNGDLPARISYQLWSGDGNGIIDSPLIPSRDPKLVNGAPPPAYFPTCTVTNVGQVNLENALLPIAYDIDGPKDWQPLEHHTKLISIPRLLPGETYTFSLISRYMRPVRFAFPNWACAYNIYERRREWTEVAHEHDTDVVELNVWRSEPERQSEHEMQVKRLRFKHQRYRPTESGRSLSKTVSLESNASLGAKNNEH